MNVVYIRGCRIFTASTSSSISFFWLDIFIDGQKIASFSETRITKKPPLHNQVQGRFLIMFWLIFVCISYHLCPQFWHTRMDLWCCFSFCLFGAKILIISAGMVKHSHQIGTHHQPIHNHQKIPWCLFFSSVSVTIWTFTFSLPQTGHFILFASYFFVFGISLNCLYYTSCFCICQQLFHKIL